MAGSVMSVRKRALFLAELAVTANVAASARVADVLAPTAYALRRRDEGFRAAWEEALAEGYAQLELQLLERALFGSPKPAAKGEPAREFSERLALALLAAHRDTVLKTRARVEAGGAQPGDGDAARKLIDALDAMTLRPVDG